MGKVNEKVTYSHVNARWSAWWTTKSGSYRVAGTPDDVRTAAKLWGFEINDPDGLLPEPAGRWVPEAEARELGKRRRLTAGLDGVFVATWCPVHEEWMEDYGSVVHATHVWTGALPEPPSEDLAHA